MMLDWLLVGSGRPAATRAARLAVSPPPMGRVGAIVTGKGFDPLHPAPERRVIHLDRQEARGQLASLGPLESAPQELEARKNHHVGGREALAHDPVGLREACLDGARLTGRMMHGLRDRIAS